jgi:hypothetical protein
MREYTSDPVEEGEAGTIDLPKITFTLDGEKFTCVGNMDGDSLLEWSELGLSASEDTPLNTPEGAAFVARFLRATFGLDEYRRFRRHIRSHNTPPETVIKVVAGIQEEIVTALEGATGRPTGPPSSSSTGDAGQDERRARIVSLQRGEVQFAPAPPPKPTRTRAKAGTGKGGKRTATGG